MLRNTVTTFTELRSGDRFYFANDKQKFPYQVTGDRLYNHVDIAGKKTWIHDRLADAKKPVIFLRHTRPAPGEEWLLAELQHNDIFYLPGDIITEYQVIKFTHELVVNCMSTSQKADLPLSTKVVFVRCNEL